MDKQVSKFSRTKVRCLVTVWALCLVFSSLVQAKTVITIAGHSYTKTTVEKSMTEYMALHPDVEIQYLWVGTSDYTGVNKLLTMNIGDSMPDIIHAYLAVSPEMLVSGMVQPVPKQLAEAVKQFFLPPLIPSVSYQGQLYGIPTENQTYTLGYNQQQFDESGIVAPPKTWDELRLLSRKLTKVDGDGRVTQNGFSIQADYIRFAHSFISMLWSNGGTYIDEKGLPHLNEQPARETIQFLADLSSNGSFSFANSIKNGKAAMSVTPTYWRNGFLTNKVVDFKNIRTTYLPNNRGPKSTYQYGWSFFVGAKSAHADIAWDFIRFMTMEKSENGLTRMSDPLVSVGSLPSNKLDLSRPEYRTDLFFRGFIDTFDVARPEPLIPQVSKRQEALFASLRPAVEGKMSIDQAVADAQQRITNITNEITQ